jgi:hypothetical protein
MRTQLTKNKATRGISAFGQGKSDSSHKPNNYKGKSKFNKKPWEKKPQQQDGLQKFDASNPGKYAAAKDWYAFTEKQREAAREARKKSGGKSSKRKASSMRRKKKVSFDDSSEAESEESDSDSEPPAKKQRGLKKLKTGSMNQRKKNGKGGDG